MYGLSARTVLAPRGKYVFYDEDDKLSWVSAAGAASKTHSSVGGSALRAVRDMNVHTKYISSVAHPRGAPFYFGLHYHESDDYTHDDEDEYVYAHTSTATVACYDEHVKFNHTPSDVTHIVVSNDGAWLVAVGGGVDIWRLPSAVEFDTMQLGTTVERSIRYTCCCDSSDLREGQYEFVDEDEDEDAEDTMIVTTFTPFECHHTCLQESRFSYNSHTRAAFSADSTLLVTVQKHTYSGALAWQLENNVWTSRPFSAGKIALYCVAFSPATTSMFATGYDDYILSHSDDESGPSDICACVWNGFDNEPLRILRGHRERVTCVAFSSDGSLLATGSMDATVRLWPGAVDAKDAHTALRVLRHCAPLNCVAFSRGGNLATACRHGYVIEWARVDPVIVIQRAWRARAWRKLAAHLPWLNTNLGLSKWHALPFDVGERIVKMCIVEKRDRAALVLVKPFRSIMMRMRAAEAAAEAAADASIFND